MRQKFSLTLVAALLLGISVFAQSQPEQKENRDAETQEHRNDGNNIVVSEGTTARLSLQTQLSSKLSEVGDVVTAILYEPVRSDDGRVAIPRGTMFIGRVTQVKAAKRPQKQATLTLSFDQMEMPYGNEKVSTVITAIDDFANDEKLKSKDGSEGQVGAGRSGGRTARNAGTGAGIGSIGGTIIAAAGGGLGGLAAGAGAGAIAGVLMTKGNDIRLAPGTILRISFQRPVNLPAFDDGRPTVKRAN